MFGAIIAAVAILVSILVLVWCGVTYCRRPREAKPKASSAPRMSAKEMQAMALHDQAWAVARELHPGIQALARGEIAPADEPELCQLLASLVSGDLNMPAARPLSIERTD